MEGAWHGFNRCYGKFLRGVRALARLAPLLVMMAEAAATCFLMLLISGPGAAAVRGAGSAGTEPNKHSGPPPYR